MFNTYFKSDSSAQIGTMCASMNRTGKSNAKKGPETDYNAFKDFFERETEGHILSRWMLFVGMDSMEGMKITKNLISNALFYIMQNFQLIIIPMISCEHFQLQVDLLV
jgi:hypothetical protein